MEGSTRQDKMVDGRVPKRPVEEGEYMVPGMRENKKHMTQRQVTPPPPEKLFIRGDFIREEREPSALSENPTLPIGSPSEYGEVDWDDEE